MGCFWYWNRRAHWNTNERKMRSKTRWFTEYAIHTSYRTLLRSSSMREPRDPLLKVVFIDFLGLCYNILYWILLVNNNNRIPNWKKFDQDSVNILLAYPYNQQASLKRPVIIQFTVKIDNFFFLKKNIKLFNDPSAGSPTETLLRLLLPLNSLVCHSSLQGKTVASLILLIPYAHYNHSIGSSDGRCVQRAGT